MKDKRKILFLSIIVLVLISLIPIIYLFSYSFATGDDYGYSVLTKSTWNNSHSIIEVIKASLSQIKGVYNSWQGTWYSVFLFALNPEIFGFGYYFLTPLIMLILHIISACLIIKTFFSSRYTYNFSESVLILSLLVFINVQFAPSYQCNLFWWVGTSHYVIPYFTGCLALYNSRKFLSSYRIRNYIVACIAFTLIGGGNYQIAIITPLVLMCSVLWDKIIDKRVYKSKAKLLLVPVILEFIGLYISMIAPGNKNRGGESFGLNIGYAIKTVLGCFVTAFSTIIDYMTQRTVIFAIFIIYGIIMYIFLSRAKDKKTLENSFKTPILMIIMTFCLYAASFAPALYADVGVSGGVFNTSFYVFVICIFYDIAYLEAFWINKKAYVSTKHNSFINKVLLFVVIIALLIMGRNSIKISTAYVSYEYISSGQADDYKEQMLLQHAILSDSSNNDPVVPFINNEQGPLQHMPVTDNPDAWTNTVTASYYGKNSIVAMDRAEWMQEYGSLYGY